MKLQEVLKCRVNLKKKHDNNFCKYLSNIDRFLNLFHWYNNVSSTQTLVHSA